MKWEYATLQLKNDHDLLSETASSHSETGLAARLGEMGRDGWELVAVWANVAFFKRADKIALAEEYDRFWSDSVERVKAKARLDGD